MTETARRYVYSVLRFVPNPGRGEFVNVGFVVGSDEHRVWALYLERDLRRAETFAGKAAPVLPNVLEHARTATRTFPAAGEAELVRFSKIFHGALQFSTPLPILARDLHTAGDTIKKHFGFDEPRRTRERGAALVREHRTLVQKKFSSGLSFGEEQRLESIRAELDRIEMDERADCLASERQHLVDKELVGSITEEDRRRLVFIQQQLVHIEEIRLAPALKKLEARARETPEPARPRANDRDPGWFRDYKCREAREKCPDLATLVERGRRKTPSTKVEPHGRSFLGLGDQPALDPLAWLPGMAVLALVAVLVTLAALGY